MDFKRPDVIIKNPDVLFDFGDDFKEKCGKPYYHMPLNRSKRVKFLEQEFKKYKENVLEIT